MRLLSPRRGRRHPRRWHRPRHPVGSAPRGLGLLPVRRRQIGIRRRSNPPPGRAAACAARPPPRRKEECPVKQYICTVCGFVYDEAKGLPDDGIVPGTQGNSSPKIGSAPVRRRQIGIRTPVNPRGGTDRQSQACGRVPRALPKPWAWRLRPETLRRPASTLAQTARARYNTNQYPLRR